MTLADDLPVVLYRKEVAVHKLKLYDRRRTGLGVVRMTKVVTTGRAAVEACKA